MSEKVTIPKPQWLTSLPLKGYQIVLPEIADYEVRRELIRAGKKAGIKRLDLVFPFSLVSPL